MNKSDKKELTNRLLTRLDDFYLNRGFKRLKKITGYERAEIFILWGASSTHIDSLTFRPWFKVENKKISDILSVLFPNQVGVNITLTREQSVEMIRELNVNDFNSSFIVVHPDSSNSYFYSIEKDTQLDPIVNDHINFMNKVGLPFFEKVKTLEDIDTYLNGRILKINKELFESEYNQIELKKYYGKREILSGLVSAFLVHNKDIQELIERYNFLFAGNHYILNDVDKIVQYFDIAL